MGLPLEINNLPLCSPKSFQCHHITVLGDFKTTSRQTGSMKVPVNTMYSAYIWSCEHPLLVALPHNTFASNSCIRYIRRSGHCAQNVFLIPFLTPNWSQGRISKSLLCTDCSISEAAGDRGPSAVCCQTTASEPQSNKKRRHRPCVRRQYIGLISIKISVHRKQGL